MIDIGGIVKGWFGMVERLELDPNYRANRDAITEHKFEGKRSGVVYMKGDHLVTKDGAYVCSKTSGQPVQGDVEWLIGYYQRNGEWCSQ